MELVSRCQSTGLVTSPPLSAIDLTLAFLRFSGCQVESPNHDVALAGENSNTSAPNDGLPVRDTFGHTGGEREISTASPAETDVGIRKLASATPSVIEGFSYSRSEREITSPSPNRVMINDRQGRGAQATILDFLPTEHQLGSGICMNHHPFITLDFFQAHKTVLQGFTEELCSLLEAVTTMGAVSSISSPTEEVGFEEISHFSSHIIPPTPPSLKLQPLYFRNIIANKSGVKGLSDTHRVNMPSLSPTMTEGTIVKWMKKEGDAITAGDVLCEIQTDKAVVSMEHDDDAILAKILVPENTADVKVGTLIALTVDEEEDWKSVEVPADSEETPAGPKSTESTSAASTSAAPPSGSHDSDRLIGPAVKNYLRKYGLESSQVSPTGPHGTVMKGDVLKHALANKIEPVAIGDSFPPPPSAPVTKASKPKSQVGAASYVDVEISNIRRTIAKRLFQSKSTIPHAYGTTQCNMKTLITFQKGLLNAGIKVSINDILIKCIGNALSLSPAIHCLKHQGKVDISVAVATANGLITPIVTNVGKRDVISISKTVRALAEKARDGKLQPHEFMGGNFSISNLGMFGIRGFSAIINPPQCATLAV
ncbi:unnamed protein product [Orchesella dallaii]|uniref:Dihydrolipoamide acetyltransferase component of pyruvate dehydrogenase complex n=1 Tax=Orchesella dallaii TaxID=48710 RepID=A0ABP1PVW6_9HEXA